MTLFRYLYSKYLLDEYKNETVESILEEFTTDMYNFLTIEFQFSHIISSKIIHTAICNYTNDSPALALMAVTYEYAPLINSLIYLDILTEN